MGLRQLVVLSGLPASGKTTLGRALAGALQAPYLDKDEILERLFDTQGTGDADHRRALSRVADGLLAQQAARLPLAVVSSWWRHPRSLRASGTEPWWLHAPGLAFVEVHCACPAPLAAERFLRRCRHPGHLDARWRHEDLLSSFTEQDQLGAITAQALTVPTGQPVPAALLAAIRDEVRRRLQDPSGRGS